MRKATYLVFVILLSVNILTAQEEKQESIDYRNEIGLDITSFIKQFIINPDNYYPTDPNYFIRYKRSYSKGNMRMSLGGYYAYNIEDENDYDIKLKSTSNHLNFKIGWEYRERLGNRWEFTYGLDFGPTFSMNKNENISSGGDYYVTYTNSSVGAVLAPVIGIRYNLTERVIISSEASLNFYWRSREEKQEFTGITDIPAHLPENTSSSTMGFGVYYSQPLSLILSFRF